MKIGITERGDAGINLNWVKKINDCDGAVLITKNLTESFRNTVLNLHRNGTKIIVHCTCTGWGATNTEPKVPDYKTQLNNLKSLIDNGFPAKNCVLRIDPIFATDKGIVKARDVLNYFISLRIAGLNRIRVSVYDEYPHTKQRFANMMKQRYAKYFHAQPIIINNFHTGAYEFLSNFFEAPVTYNGLCFKNSEAAFQAQKTSDNKLRKTFCAMTGSEAKRAGKSPKNGGKINMSKEEEDKWKKVRYGIMKDIVRAKFEQNPTLKQELLKTGNAILIEGNGWKDYYWGVCNGKGENKLGEILMEIRDEFMSGSINKGVIVTNYRQASEEQMQAVATMLNEFSDNYGFSFELCAEEMLFSMLHKAERIGCVSEKDLNILGIPFDQNMGINPQNRSGCHCLSCKTELLTEKKRCQHECVYCFWRD